MPEEKKRSGKKVNAWIPDDLYFKVDDLKYKTWTEAIVTGLELLVKSPEKVQLDENKVQESTRKSTVDESEVQESIRKSTVDESEVQKVQIVQMQAHIETFKLQMDLLTQQLHTKDEQIEKLNENMHKQAVHTQSLIQEISRLNIKSLPEAPAGKEVKKKWFEFWK